MLQHEAEHAEQELLASFERTSEEWFSLEEFQRLLRSGRQLRIKYGVDVTAPFLHLGHAVNLWMMRQMQDLGHKVIFLLGDFTTTIGDPTGRNKLRPIIPSEEIEANAQEFIKQARMVLRFDDPDLLEIRRNSEWYQAMSVQELLHLLSMVTHSRLVARDMFQMRMKQGLEIHMHELLYPVLQGYDSFMLDSDLTIIGSDQLFNELMGRFYQEHLGQSPQVVITTKITPGIDGKAKQSKSLGNYIGLGHSPRDKFGRTMTLPDSLIVTYFEVYTDLPIEDIDEIRRHVGKEPMQCKLRLAYEIVKRYHGEAVAEQELRWFQETFSARQTPEDIPEITLEQATQTLLELLKELFAGQKSNRELRRLCEQGGVSRNNEVLRQPEQVVEVCDGDVFRVGKRTWFRVRLL
ncbi:tyrosine--tRNA ligase [Ktedonobacter sp. SOSP1-85]|uniref:tyrosine--tRNA ligase n=1 Tax=Ktedonobacter sp. SOSP1-85 TaxID=2778367 RepID=UPI00191689E0|nr:tyrosine--tRNA ligase [Ktedonobacter sp. SOSP1-85]GHO79235.1 tyrosine--tRNA ligase [Ktedonobacter sp. SOSP1-85]